MNTEQQREYDQRRLIVLSTPGSTGIWYPWMEENIGLVKMVEHGTLGLSPALSDDFNAWIRLATGIKLRKDDDDVPNERYVATGWMLAEELARFVGDKYQVEYNGKRILADLDVNPLSRAFFFDKRYTPYRNKRDFRFSFYRTYLTALLRYEMSDDDREKIFPGMFDLGNGRTIPRERCTYSDLAQELSKELPGDREVDTNGNPFKSMKDGVEKLIRCSVSTYIERNPSTTFKVIKLLFRMLNDRHNRLFHFLKLPDAKRYTLEFRETTPFVKDEISTEEAVWLISDLKTYLSIELEEDTFIEIQRMFDIVPRLLESFRHGAETVFVETYGGNYEQASAAYLTLTEAVQRFTFEHEHCDLALDEDLCAYVQSLEFFHYAIGMPELLHKAIPDLIVTPVVDELRAFTLSISPDAANIKQAHVPLLSIDGVPQFIRQNSTAILSIMGKAMGPERIGWGLEEAIVGAHNLVHNFFWFLREAPRVEIDTTSARVSPWICVSALCCVWHAMKHPQSHQPYWRLMPHAEGLPLKQPTRSLLAALKDSQHEQGVSDRMSLEHRHIWRHRLEWFCDSLNGQSDLLAPKFAYRVALVGKLMEILRGTCNRDSQIKVLNDFYEHVKSAALAIK